MGMLIACCPSCVVHRRVEQELLLSNRLSMATASTVSAWKLCLKHLPQLTADPNNKDAVTAAGEKVLFICKSPHVAVKLPKATWKKLVQQLKVCEASSST